MVEQRRVEVFIEPRQRRKVVSIKNGPVLEPSKSIIAGFVQSRCKVGIEKGIFRKERTLVCSDDEFGQELVRQ